MRQTLLSPEDLPRLGLHCCPDCGGGSFDEGVLCIYESGDDGKVTTQSVWCRDCERGTRGATLAEAVKRWNQRWDEWDVEQPDGGPKALLLESIL